MTNGEIKLCALDPHQRELQVDISWHMIASHMSHLWANPRFEATRRKNTEFSQCICDVTVSYDILA